MTKRLRFPNIWAEGGVATDPDLDTTAPSFEEDKYAKYGWKSEKPPEEWQNFLSQISDAKIVAMMFDGVPEKDASVTYPNGAVYKESGTIKVVVSGVGQPIVEIKNAQFAAIVADLQKKMSNHLASDNPHQDTVNTLVDKSYIKTDVDSFFGSASDPRTIVYHKNPRGGAVHGETPAQVGTLPTSGGTFTGPVVIEKNATVNPSPSKLLHLNGSTGLFELAGGTVSIGIDGSGKCWVVTTDGMFQIMTNANYDEFQARWNYQFALPLPYLKANFNNSLSDADSVGSWVVETPSNPVFGNGLQIDNNDARLIFDDITSDVTVHLIVIEADGTKTTYFKDFSSWNFQPNTSKLQTIVSVSFGGTDPKFIREYTVYQTLTAYQKSMLVK